MAATYMLCSGKIVDGEIVLQVAMPPLAEDIALARMAVGRRLYEAGASRSACVNEDEGIGYDEAEWEAYQEQMMAREAEELARLQPLQDIIDAAAELEDLREDMEDREYWSRGQW